jgi:lysyl-tRNA synthetase class 2
MTVSDAFQKYAGWNPITDYNAERFELDLIEKVTPSFPQQRPLVLMDYPAAEASLSRLKPGAEDTCERAEVFIAGMEIANAFSELTDAAEQQARFRVEIEKLRKEGKGYYELPARFLEALANMPPCGGIALGIDRLVMLFRNTDRIDDVIAFPWSADHD